MRIVLRGRHTASSAEAFLEKVAETFSGARIEGSELFAELHPGAEALEIRATGNEVELRASTGTAGPGYHRHVVELADALDVEWTAHEDETDFFAGRDGEKLESAFLDWLADAARQILELSAGGTTGFALGMAAGHHFQHDGVVATQTGPRDRAWLDEVCGDPRRGLDVFPWSGEGHDARYFRGLALSQMWTEVRWREPLDDGERALLDRVATWIERAHGLDSELDLPWAAQSEIFTLLGEESLRATRAHVRAQSRAASSIGYRRRPVRVTLSGGWTLSVAGEMAERWDERGTWVAWDAGRSIFFNSLEVQDADGVPSKSAADTLAQLPPLSGDEILELERDELRGFAAFVTEERDGETLHRLEAHAAVDEHAAVGTLVFVEESDREWALDTWASLFR